MPKNQKRIRAVDSKGKPYRGVYVYEREDAGGRVTRTYYITYTRGGRGIEEKAGVASPGFRAKDAADLRYRKMNEGGITNKERRSRLAKEAQEAKKAKEASWSMERVFNTYMEAQGGHKSAAQDNSRWKVHLSPILAGKKPEDIVALDVDRIKKAARDGNYSKSTLRNNLELLRRLLNFARDRDLCVVSDVKVKLPDPDNQKTEFLTPGQIQKLMEALEQESDAYLVGIVKMALLTGMRRGELFKLEWEDIDRHRGFITIRSPKGGKTQEIPLNKAAEEILESLPRKKDSPYVFPGRGGNQRQDVSKGLRRLRKNADLPTDFRMLHGLRHTFASSLASSGKVDLHTLQKLLTHKGPQMTQRYAHLSDAALHRAAAVAADIIPVDQGNHDDRQTAKRSGRKTVRLDGRRRPGKG